jgi:5-methylcytosine-specific restriction protein A
LEGQASVADEFALSRQVSITEIRKYAYHRKVERNRAAERYAKKFHGHRCQACNLDFAEYYGDIGEGFIEVHHLRPISSLEEGVAVRYDVAEDLAVLCSNCHRMIHRYCDPSDLATFRTIIRNERTDD